VRLDLFLKTSRLIKRRTIARELCDSGRVLVNGHPAKPGRDVQPGDRLTLTFTTRIVEAEILAEPAPMRPGRPSLPSYRILSESRIAENTLWTSDPS
jgi:ribosomal 50S subunit-recycling heat shock protein